MPVLLALSVLAALAFGLHWTHQPPSAWRMVVKGTAVGCLALASLWAGGPPLLTLALALGTLGDLFLAAPQPRAFLAGLVAFLLGHLAYVALFLAYADIALLGHPARLGAAVLLALAAALVLRRLAPHLGSMRLPVFAYGAVILAMGLSALTLPMVWPLALALPGALLFIVSDAILGFALFGPDASARRRGPATALWCLYWGGQALIFAAFAYFGGV